MKMNDVFAAIDRYQEPPAEDDVRNRVLAEIMNNTSDKQEKELTLYVMNHFALRIVLQHPLGEQLAEEVLTQVSQALDKFETELRKLID